MKLWFALITVISSVAMTAFAQTPPSGVMDVPTLGAAPAPTAPAPAPVVGVNSEPAPSTLPAGYPTTAPAPSAPAVNTAASTLQSVPALNTAPTAPVAVPLPARARLPVAPSFVPLTPEQMQRKSQELLGDQHGLQERSDLSKGAGRLEMTEQHQQKSEVISVLPPAQRAPEVRAVLRTSVGDITVRLDRLNAPHTANYFAGLAGGNIDFTDIKTSKPVKRPFYNGLVFHYVIKNMLIQTGDPFGNGRGGTGQTITDEIKPTMKFDRPGLVAMAPARDSGGTGLAKNSNSSQFFITLKEMPEWNGQFTIFGEVEDGLDVVQKIANAKVGPTGRPIKRIYLVAVEIIESAK
jgi:peptidyl-prolyl cis-trans isomerase A (cyclophilin A)